MTVAEIMERSRVRRLEIDAEYKRGVKRIEAKFTAKKAEMKKEFSAIRAIYARNGMTL